MNLTERQIEKLSAMIQESIVRQLNEKEKEGDKRFKQKASGTKLNTVLKWLHSEQENNAAIARELWPDMDDDTARSLFSKKMRGHDSTGKEYSFNEDEITTMYNMKDRFISKIK